MTSRKNRRSQHTATQFDIPKPSAKELKKWKPLVDLCKSLILTNERTNLGPKKNKVRIVFPMNSMGHSITPEGWPIGRKKKVVGGGKVSLEYNAEYVLIWLYERKLSDKCPSDLYRERHKSIKNITLMIKELDLDVEEEDYEEGN